REGPEQVTEKKRARFTHRCVRSGRPLRSIPDSADREGRGRPSRWAIRITSHRFGSVSEAPKPHDESSIKPFVVGGITTQLRMTTNKHREPEPEEGERLMNYGKEKIGIYRTYASPLENVRTIPESS